MYTSFKFVLTVAISSVGLARQVWRMGGSGQNWGNGDGGRMEEEEENPTVVKSRTYAKHSFEKLNMQNTVGKTQTFASHIGETKPYNEEEVNLGGSLGQAGIESEIGMTNPTFV